MPPESNTRLPAALRSRNRKLRQGAVLLAAGISAIAYQQIVVGVDADAEAVAEGSLAPGFFVSPTGSDANPGTEAAPFRTVEKAASLVRAGQTIHLRGGLYTSRIVVGYLAGTAAAPITISSYPGEIVVVDGESTPLGKGNSLVGVFASTHVIVKGLEVRNSKAVGMAVSGGSNVTFRNNHVHNSQSHLMQGTGDNHTFERNDLHHGSLVSRDGGNNGAGLSTWSEGNRRSTNIKFLNNTIHDVYGECLNALHVSGAVVRGNRIYNCGTGIYLDNADNVVVDGNYVYRVPTEWTNKFSGILLGRENYPGMAPASHPRDITISNNIVTGAGWGVSMWYHPDITVDNTYSNVRILHNVIKDNNANVVFHGVPAGMPAPTGNELKNNIISGSGMWMGNPEGWSISHNNFTAGKAMGTNATTHDPQFVDGGSIGDPGGFELRSTSPLRQIGTPYADVKTDFWGTARSSSPSIGVHESQK